jgi:glucokinase
MSTLVFDIGGTTTRLAIATNGTLGRVVTFATPKLWHEVEQTFRTQASRIIAGHRVTSAIGGIPGMLDARNVILLRASNLRGWDKTPIAQILRRASLVSRVRLANDANLAGLGEAVYGAGKGYRVVGYLVVSTGVGGTRIVDKELDVVAMGFRPGHQIIDRSSSATCGCGQRGD